MMRARDIRQGLNLEGQFLVIFFHSLCSFHCHGCGRAENEEEVETKVK